MKKTLSFMLAMILILCTLGTLPITVSAASGGNISRQWNFDDSTISGKTDAGLISAIGWSSVTSNFPNGLRASISNGALRLQNSTGTPLNLLVYNNVGLKEGYVIEYDFMYSTKSNLPSAAGSYTQYNSKADESAHFAGSRDTGDAATWFMQPRINGNLLNSPKTTSGSWIDTSKLTQNYAAAANVLGRWYTVRIEFSPEKGVTAFVKLKGTDAWSRTDCYTDSTLAAAKSNCASFVTQYLRMCVRGYVDVCLDNISVSPYVETVLPVFVGYQTSATSSSKFTLRLIAAIGDRQATKVGYKVKMTTYNETTGVRTVSTKEVDCNYVYRSITYQEGNRSVTATANDLCPGMEYLVILHIENISRRDGYSYEVSPFIEKDGKIQYGATLSFSHMNSITDIPSYDTSSGTVNVSIPFSIGGCATTQVVGSTVSEMNAYVTKLQQSGYTLYQSRDNVNGNYFRTLYNANGMVHVYFMPAAKTGGDYSQNVVRIVTSNTPLSSAFKKEAYGDTAVTEGTATFMSIDYSKQGGGNNGLGMVFTNPDGSYVIVDGGWKYDTTKLYNFLKDNNKRTDGKILIRAWIITHPHQDHWGNFVEFANRYAGQKGYDNQSYNYSNVKVEYVVEQMSQQYCNANAQVYDGAKVTREATAKFGAKHIIPHTGQVMYFGALQVEFLYTLETMLTTSTVNKYIQGVDGNEQSLILRAKFATGQSVLITGDATKNESVHLDSMYQTHLKSDIVTLPHHGIDETTSTFYETYIKPKYVLVATSAEQTQSRYNSNKNKVGSIYKAVQYAVNNGGAYYAADGDYRTFKIQSGS